MKKDIKKHFEVVSESKDDKKNEAEIVVKPLSKEMSIDQLTLLIDTTVKKTLVREISFNDEVGNKTTFFFPKVYFQDRKNAKLFKYTPAKGVKVLEL
jgi:hypothetical protein